MRHQSAFEIGLDNKHLIFTLYNFCQKKGCHSKARKVRSKEILDKFWQWVSSFHVLVGSKLGKAINYALNNRTGLMNFLLDGRCALSNNLAERSIRPTTIGRKNWNFSASTRGATANGIVYSLVETAKENGIHPTEYFEFLFEHLPNLSSLSALEAYLVYTRLLSAYFLSIVTWS